jgi:hypothetical protein
MRAVPKRVYEARTPAAAERMIAWLGDLAGGVVQSVSDDQNGWDLMVEYPAIQGSDLPPDVAPPGYSVKVQVKSSKTARKSVRLSLSNALKYARHPLPYFVVLVTTERSDHDPTVYIRHIWKDDIANILKAARAAHLAGKPLNKAGFTLRFQDEDRHDRAAMTYVADLIDTMKPNYASQKENLNDTVGYDEGYGVANLEFDATDVDRLVDTMLGVGEGLALTRATYNASRFDMKDPVPEFDGPGVLSVTPSSVADCVLTFAPQDARHEEVNLKGKVFSPGIPNLPQTHWKLRFSTPLVEVMLRPDGASTVKITASTAERLPFEDLAKLIRMRAWAARGPMDIRIWSRDQLLTSGSLEIGSGEDAAYWARLERVATALAGLTPAERRPTDLALSVVQMSEALLELEKFEHAVTAPQDTLSAATDRPLSIEAFPPELARAVWVGVEDIIFYAIVSRPVVEIDGDGQDWRVEVGAPRILSSAILTGGGGANRTFIDADLARFGLSAK